MVLDSHVIGVIEKVSYLLFHTYESLPAGYIVDCNTGVRVAEVGLWYGLEALLPSCIPKLKFQYIVVNFDLLDFEINADGAALYGIENVLRKAQ